MSDKRGRRCDRLLLGGVVRYVIGIHVRASFPRISPVFPDKFMTIPFLMDRSCLNELEWRPIFRCPCLKNDLDFDQA